MLLKTPSSPHVRSEREGVRRLDAIGGRTLQIRLEMAITDQNAFFQHHQSFMQSILASLSDIRLAREARRGNRDQAGLSALACGAELGVHLSTRCACA